MSKAIFYYAGCTVYVDTEQMMLGYFDKSKKDLGFVQFGEDALRISEAENAGIKSVPALVVGDQVYQINFSASMEDVKNR